MIRYNMNKNSQSPNFKSICIKYKNWDEVENILTENGLNNLGVNTNYSMFPPAVDEFLVSCNVKMIRERIDSDKGYKYLFPFEHNEILIISKSSVENNIKKILEKARIFVGEVKDL